MSAIAPTRVDDELDLIRRLLPLAGARVADIGCGSAAMSRRLLGEGLARSVAGLEVDEAQHARNIAAGPVPGLSFHLAPADAIPFPDASFDAALMLKSLHHVPAARMDAGVHLHAAGHDGTCCNFLYCSCPVHGMEQDRVAQDRRDVLEELVRWRRDDLQRASSAHRLLDEPDGTVADLQHILLTAWSDLQKIGRILGVFEELPAAESPADNASSLSTKPM